MCVCVYICIYIYCIHIGGYLSVCYGFFWRYGSVLALVKRFPDCNGSVRASRFPRFIPLVRFMAILLVVSILDIVGDSHLQ